MGGDWLRLMTTASRTSRNRYRRPVSDSQFDELAKSVATTTLVAHVRQASVGGTALVNTHPFVYGRWVFVHNGTLQEFCRSQEVCCSTRFRTICGK